jgi:heme a synthase
VVTQEGTDVVTGHAIMAGAQEPWSPWPHRFALVTTTATFFLILAGGIVTNTGTGMAVPDWPTTFGHNMFLYPWSKMVGGILYEHAHRLIASLVGALTLTLAILLWALEPRPWVRGLGIAALGAVVVQGVLGGLRVVLAQHGLAIVHGGFAHAFFALLAGLTLVTSPGWCAPVAESVASPALLRLRRLAVATTAGLYLQVLLGTLVTHLSARLDVHLFVGGLISVAVILLGFRILPGRAEWPELVRPAETLRVLWIVQLLLGLGAYLAKFQPMDIGLGAGFSLVLSVSHRLAGGLMLITSLVIVLRICRRTVGSDPAAGRRPVSREVTT